MPGVNLLLRNRRRREAGRRAPARWGSVGAGAAAAAVLAVASWGWIGAQANEAMIAGLPPVESVEALFGPRGREHLPLTRLFDRTGTVLLWESAHPRASNARWLSLGGGSGPEFMASGLPHAAVAGLDPDFWVEPDAWSALTLPWNASQTTSASAARIPERLAGLTLLPVGQSPGSAQTSRLAVAAQAARLRQRYPPERILEWFLNSVPFAADIYGVDAAAWVYLGKSAADLTLAESAWLIGSLQTVPGIDPSRARQRQLEILQALETQGIIGRADALLASSEKVILQTPAEAAPGVADDFVRHVLQVLQPEATDHPSVRPGLRIVTTLDMDLQLQVECAVRTQVRRLSGGGPDVVVPAADGTPCVVAGLLPPLRPGDLEMDHALESAAVMVIDSDRGEVRAALGEVDEPLPSGAAFAPLAYLAAFSRGYSPATMVLDLPPEPARTYAAYQGPVRMRIALANALPGALQATLQVADPAYVLSVAGQMGLQESPLVEADYAAGIAAGRSPASLLDMTYAFSVLANDGTMTGTAVPAARIRPGYRELDPSVILSVQDDSDGAGASYEPVSQAVLSPSLAYLVGDVLRDPAARLSSGASVSALDPGREAAVIDGPSAGEETRWTLGYSPPIVVGVWFRAAPAGALAGVDSYNGPAAIWKAVLQYATRDLPARGFPPPAGTVELDVCDPSGLLPTPYCPKIVREVFAQGTEPVHYDHLFRPFRVNRETGKLATLFTPLDLVEERTYLIPPPEAEAWAQAVGFPSPPTEYDPLPERLPFDGDVNVARPTVLEILHGRVVIRGDASIPDQASFRLQFGEGLNPTRWISIGDQRSDPVRDGSLAEWDTSGLNGLVTLQLVAVDRSGSVRTAAVPVILDNLPPGVQVVLPAAGQSIDPAAAQLVLEAFAQDETGVSKVEFLIDGARVAVLTQAPYSVRVSTPRPGEHRLVVRAFDAAGNVAESAPVVFQVGN